MSGCAPHQLHDSQLRSVNENPQLGVTVVHSREPGIQLPASYELCSPPNTHTHNSLLPIPLALHPPLAIPPHSLLGLGNRSVSQQHILRCSSPVRAHMACHADLQQSQDVALAAGAVCVQCAGSNGGPQALSSNVLSQQDYERPE